MNHTYCDQPPTPKTRTVTRLQLLKGLQSGKWVPKQGALRGDTNSRCCLGVALELAGYDPKTFIENGISHAMPSNVTTNPVFRGEHTEKPDDLYVRNDTPLETTLSRLNDATDKGWDLVIEFLEDKDLWNRAARKALSPTDVHALIQDRVAKREERKNNE